MAGRSISLAAAIVCGIVTSQVPEFGQQYRQRLAGAVDELQAIVNSFDQDASRVGYTRDQAIAALSRAQDPFPRERAKSMTETIERYDRLTRQQAEFRSEGPFGRVVVLFKDMDPTLAENTWADFEPGVPTTLEGGVAAGIGAVGGMVLVNLIGLAGGRRRRRAEA